MEKLKRAKEQCLSDLTESLPRYANRLNAIDPRLMAYIEDAVSNGGSHANVYELLGIRKELRLMDSYDMTAERVQMTLRAIEGVWNKNRHVKGGLKFDTPRGNQHVRLMPYQVWCLFGIYGFTEDVDMDREWRDGDILLPTEFVRDGRVYDTRRLTTEADIFQTRKSGKTEFGAAIDFTEASVLGPVNAQVLICTNSREQSKIAYKAIKEFAYQVDPTCLNKMGGKYFRVTADEMNWQPGLARKGEIKVMSAGGKKKDGLYASLVHADEHGQDEYINGHGNMQELVDVCVGSMGPRRERLLLHTTTAGRVKEGPYKNHLEQHVEPTLLKELDYPLDGKPHRTADDHWFAFLLRLDPWEVTYELDQLDNPELFKKVNRSIGITVQPTWYKERLHDARSSEDTKKEVLTKDFNIWQDNRITSWLTSDQIRPRQKPMRVTDCRYADGWSVFCGLDFGGKDDLWAHTYLAVNYKQQSPVGRLFADCMAWITEAALKKSPNRPLYEQWIQQGWLQLCPGDVMEPAIATNEMMMLHQQGINLFRFGYDPAQSKMPVNTIKAWLQTLGIVEKDIRQMVVPVPQTFLASNGLVNEIEYMLLNQEPWLSLSENPMWAWEFDNCSIEVTSSKLRRPLKSMANKKVDNIHALLDAMYCFDLTEGNVQT